MVEEEDVVLDGEAMEELVEEEEQVLKGDDGLLDEEAEVCWMLDVEARQLLLDGQDGQELACCKKMMSYDWCPGR